MSLDAVKILGINITKSPKKEILEFLQISLFTGRKYGQKSPKNTPNVITIVTPNPELIVLAAHNSKFADMLNRADVTLPDGVGVVWASHFLSPKFSHGDQVTVAQTIPGIDFMEELVSQASKRHVPIALIGSWKGLAVKSLDCLSEKYSGLQGWGVDGPEIAVRGSGVELPSAQGYFAPLAKRIVETEVQMVFVGLGAPKQEYFIEALKKELDVFAMTRPIVLMAVGGAFDEISGRIPRAPRWVSGVGLKWLWRLIIEPWRIVRQLALLKFVGLVVQEKLSIRSR